MDVLEEEQIIEVVEEARQIAKSPEVTKLKTRIIKRIQRNFETPDWKLNSPTSLGIIELQAVPRLIDSLSETDEFLVLNPSEAGNTPGSAEYFESNDPKGKLVVVIQRAIPNEEDTSLSIIINHPQLPEVDRYRLFIACILKNIDMALDYEVQDEDDREAQRVVLEQQVRLLHNFIVDAKNDGVLNCTPRQRMRRIFRHPRKIMTDFVCLVQNKTYEFGIY